MYEGECNKINAGGMGFVLPRHASVLNDKNPLLIFEGNPHRVLEQVLVICRLSIISSMFNVNKHLLGWRIGCV
jgi:hypothetical protein